MEEGRLEKLEIEVDALKARNARVEAEKAWETSYARIFSVAFITYLVATCVLYFIGVQNFFLGALVPTVGYILSTQSLPAVRKWWIATFLK